MGSNNFAVMHLVFTVLAAALLVMNICLIVWHKRGTAQIRCANFKFNRYFFAFFLGVYSFGPPSLLAFMGVLRKWDNKLTVFIVVGVHYLPPHNLLPQHSVHILQPRKHLFWLCVAERVCVCLVGWEELAE